VVHDILNQVKEELPQEITKQKMNFLDANNIASSHPMYEKFLNAPVKHLSWSDYGSKDPSSDLDITLKGDYTQFAVKLFNEKMANRFNQREPGIIFDANVYSENCIPEIEKTDFSQNFRKEFLHKSYPKLENLSEKSIEDHLSKNNEISVRYNLFFSQMKEKPSFEKFINLNKPHLKEIAEKIQLIFNPQLKKEALRFYEIASLLKIRRYMTPVEWKDFSHKIIKAFSENGLDQSKIRKKLMLAELNYVNNVSLLKEKLEKDNKGQRTLLNQKSIIVDSGSWEKMMEQNKKNEEYIQQFSPNDVMRAENVIYEEMLSHSSNIKMNLDWCDMNTPKVKEDYTREKLLLELEKAQCESKYFANEAYVTPASLVSVVINKQMLSRGLYPQKQYKEKYFKIPLRVDEHLISLNEQLGDFFKEATRSIKVDQPYAIEDSVGLKSGKYIHRFANSYQSIYEGLNIKDEMQLNQSQLKACSYLEALKKDVRTMDQKALEIRGSIFKIFSGKEKISDQKIQEAIINKKTPQEELNNFKKILMDIHVKAYVDVYKNDNMLSE
jgi:hypothetical protein